MRPAQIACTICNGESAMKVHVEIDCSPEEARAFMGLPDLSKAQAAYSEGMEKAMRGVSNPDQLQELAKTMAPMGLAM